MIHGGPALTYWTFVAIVGALPFVAACGGRTGLSSPNDAGAVADVATPNEDCHLCSCDVCLSGQCVASARRIAAETSETHSIAVDGNDLYWTVFVNYGPTGGLVRHGTTSGGAPTTLASGQYLPVATTTNTTSVFWGSNNSPPIRRVDKGGGAFSTVISGAASSNRPAFTVDDASIFWTNGVAVFMTPLGGGKDTLLWSGSGASGFAEDPSGIYFRTGTSVFRASRTNQPTVEVAPSRGDGFGFVALDATSVFWTVSNESNKPTSSIYRAPKGGGTTTTLVEGFYPVESIAVGGAWLYFASVGFVEPPEGGPSRYMGRLARVPRAGGNVQILADCMQGLDLAADSTGVYFTTGHGVFALAP